MMTMSQHKIDMPRHGMFVETFPSSGNYLEEEKTR